jgi:hypothetical protein
MTNISCEQTSLPTDQNCRRLTNAGILLYTIEEAKTKLAEGGAPVETAAAIMSALADLICSDATAKTVADRYALVPSAVHYWAKRAGLPERPRGRRSAMRPNSKLQRILDAVRVEGIAAAARRAGVSRQRVFQIVCRWEPQLKGRRIGSKVVEMRQPARQPRRNIVVSFRISTEEWEKLLIAKCGDGRRQMSGFAKARAIVLGYLNDPNDGTPLQLRFPRACY